jgi:hypothetical protein
MAPKYVKNILESCTEKIRGKVFHESHSSTEVGDVMTYLRGASFLLSRQLQPEVLKVDICTVSELSAVLLLYVQDSWYLLGTGKAGHKDVNSLTVTVDS